MSLLKYRVSSATNVNNGVVWYVLQQSTDGGTTWSVNMTANQVPAGVKTTGGYVASQTKADIDAAQTTMHTLALNNLTDPNNWTFAVVTATL